MSVELILKKVIFKNYALIAEMRIDKFHIYDVVSLVDGIDATSLEFLVSALNELIIGDDIAKLLQDGLYLNMYNSYCLIVYFIHIALHCIFCCILPLCTSCIFTNQYVIATACFLLLFTF